MSDQTRLVPADRGLSGLGLLMQVSGTAFAALSAFFGVSLMITAKGAPGDDDKLMWLLAVTTTAVWRSLAHRQAGTTLLYAEQAHPFAGIKRYVWVALGNTAAWAWLLSSQLHVPNAMIVPLVGSLLAWPLALLVVVNLPGFRELGDRIPRSEDNGFEGAAILMFVFGLLWLLLMSSSLVALWSGTPPELHAQGTFVMVVLAMMALVIRSGLHVGAGWIGLHETRLDQIVAAANRYCDFGVLSSFLASGLLLLAMMMLSPDPMQAALIACLFWGLLAWPMILRRLFAERQFADLLAHGDVHAPHVHAPDRGLTTLGWLLLAHALLQLGADVPMALSAYHAGHAAGAAGPLASLLAASAGSSPWWSIGVAALELWAAIELLRMSELHRIAASAYGAIAAAVTVYRNWDLLTYLAHGHAGISDSAMGFAVLATALALPAATLFLVNRNAVPAAAARYT
jgi:hypothetical protein